MWRTGDTVRYGLRAVNSEEVTRKIRTSLARVCTNFLTSTYPTLLIKMLSFLLLWEGTFHMEVNFMACFREGWCVYLRVTFLVLLFFNSYSLRCLIWQGIISWTPSEYWFLFPVFILAFIGPWKEFSLSMYDFELAEHEKSLKKDFVFTFK